MLSFSIREEPDALIVCLVEPDAMNDFRSNAFRDALYEAVLSRDQRQVAVDLGQLDFLSSSGVAILVGLKRRLESKGGNLVMFSVQPVVRELLRVTRLNGHLVVTGDESDALARLRLPPTE